MIEKECEKDVEKIILYFEDKGDLEIKKIPQTVSELIIENYNEHTNTEKTEDSTSVSIKLRWELRDILIPQCIKKIIINTNLIKLSKKNIIPETVTHLIIGNNYTNEITKGVIGNSITHLSIQSKIQGDITIPKSVINLSINYDNNIKIPNTVRILRYLNDITENLDDDNLPKNLEELILLKTHFFNFVNYSKKILCGVYDNKTDDEIEYVSYI
jgi:hypothetical protein